MNDLGHCLIEGVVHRLQQFNGLQSAEHTVVPLAVLIELPGFDTVIDDLRSYSIGPRPLRSGRNMDHVVCWPALGSQLTGGGSQPPVCSL